MINTFLHSTVNGLILWLATGFVIQYFYGMDRASVSVFLLVGDSKITVALDLVTVRVT